MKITIQKEVFEKLPELHVAFFKVECANNEKNLKESKIMLEETAQLVRLLYHKDSIRSHHLISPWQLARLDMKQKVKPMHSAVEYYFNRALKSQSVTASSTVENILRHVVFRHIVPGSTDDMDNIKGSLTFKLAKQNHTYSWLTKVQKNDLIYKDNSKVKPILGAKLDFAKNKRTKTTPKSQNILLHLDFLAVIPKQKREHIIKETKQLLETFLQTKVKTVVLNQKKNQAII